MCQAWLRGTEASATVLVSSMFPTDKSSSPSAIFSFNLLHPPENLSQKKSGQYAGLLIQYQAVRWPAQLCDGPGQVLWLVSLKQSLLNLPLASPPKAAKHCNPFPKQFCHPSPLLLLPFGFALQQSEPLRLSENSQKHSFIKATKSFLKKEEEKLFGGVLIIPFW